MERVLYGGVVILAATMAASAGALPVDVAGLLLPAPQRVEQLPGEAVTCRTESALKVTRGCVPGAPDPVADQAYVLTVGPDGVSALVGGEAGERYARTTLRQLVRLAGGAPMPQMRIVDWPALRWRGVMNDCGRNFLSVEGVKAFIDVAAAYKMNLFHWHLTDYHGWRLESKLHPELQAERTFARQKGQFYTQDDFRDVVGYAAARGVTVMPEFDVPGHTLAFRKGMKVEAMKEQGIDGVVCELIDELCSLVPRERMPFVHLGTDEVRVDPERVPEGWCTSWANAVARNGRIAVGWAPGERLSPTGAVYDMVWHDNYVTNSVHPSFDAAGMYFMNMSPFRLLTCAAFQRPCTWDVPSSRILGAIACCWHDDNLGEDTMRLFRNVAVVPAILGFADNFWRGRAAKRRDLMRKMPRPGTEEFAFAQDLERRLIAQRGLLREDVGLPFPFLRQTDMRWRLSDETGRVFARDVAQAEIDLNACAAATGSCVVAETWIRSPRRRDVGAWIGMTRTGGAYIRTDIGLMPERGEWSSSGSTVEVNGVRVPPPDWRHPGARVRESRDADGKSYRGIVYSDDLCETPIDDEWYFVRPPSRVELKEGWNHVRIAVRRAARRFEAQWCCTFAVFDGDSAHPVEIPDLEYSSDPPDFELSAEDNAEFTTRIRHKPGDRFWFVDVTPKVGATAREVAALKLRPIRLFAQNRADRMKALGTAGLTDVGKNPGSYGFLAVAEPGSRRGVVAGWLTHLKASGIVFSEVSEDGVVVIRPEAQYGRCLLSPDGPGPVTETFVIGSFSDVRDGLEAYADAVAARFGVSLKPQISGYCTWYADRHGQAGDERSTAEFADWAAASLAPWGLDFFQIDDQWQSGSTTNGPNKNFTAHRPDGPYPAGMKAAARTLEAKGLCPGLWFMPFSGSMDDPHWADKTNWFARSRVTYPAPGEPNRRKHRTSQKKGEPVYTDWGGDCLDMSNPAACAYLGDTVRRMSRDWGYRYFKFDGMWTATAADQLYVNDGWEPDNLGEADFADPHVTGIELFRKGVSVIREAAGPEAFLLACNAGQSLRACCAAYGLVDAMRIGPDNWASSWEGIMRGPVRGTARYFWNGRIWYNDPDPVYVRDSIPLNHAVAIASWVSLSGQLYAFSDWPLDLSAERVDILRRTIAPHRLCRNVRPVDLMESEVANGWMLDKAAYRTLGLFNWSEKKPLAVDWTAEYAGLDPEREYAVWDYWGDKAAEFVRGRVVSSLAGASCRILHMRALEPDRPVLVSTSRHVAGPAFDVVEERWDRETKTLSGRSERLVPGERYVLTFVTPERTVVRREFRPPSSAFDWSVDFSFNTEN